MTTAALAAAILAVASAQPAPPPAAGTGAGAAAPVEGPFFPEETCRICHPAIVAQHLESHHHQAWTNPLFQAQLFRDVAPAAATDPGVARDLRGCVACHAPVAIARGGPLPARAGDVPAETTGVTCDACHVITGFEGKQPRNGNYVLSPGSTKYGPFQADNDWHRAYSELHTRSELCAICHQAVNRHGVRVKTTYDEWRESPQAARGVQCQDCHMSLDGYAVHGTSRFEKGSAAVLFGQGTAARDRVPTHRFPGVHSASQLEGAMGLVLAVDPQVARPGQPLDVQVAVNNSRAAHATPTGSAELRLLWLEVTLKVGSRTIPVPAKSRWGPSWTEGVYEIAGQGPLDAGLLGADVPPGSRVYRVILADEAGKATLSHWEARSVVADTRLKAGVIRTERYRVTVPEDASGAVTVGAVLRYRSTSSAFTERYGLPPAPVVEVARASRELDVASRPAPPPVVAPR